MEPAPEAVSESQGLMHALGQIGPTAFGGGEINGDLSQGQLVSIVNQGVQGKEHRVVGGKAAVVGNRPEEGLVDRRHDEFGAKAQHAHRFSATGLAEQSQQGFPPALHLQRHFAIVVVTSHSQPKAVEQLRMGN